MRQTGDALRLSATDLANHLACHHLSYLDLAVARGQRRPPDWFAPDVAVLRERGIEHETAFLSHLEGQGLRIARPGDDLDDNRGFERTISAMREGADVIVQATLLDGRWSGRADVLRRVSRPSRLGDWSYEVWDTKLARETKGGSVLQICLYSDLLETIQGARPEHMYIVPPRDDFKPDVYRVDDFMAYYRVVRRRLEAAIGAAPAAGAGVSPRVREGAVRRQGTAGLEIRRAESAPGRDQIRDRADLIPGERQAGEAACACGGQGAPRDGVRGGRHGRGGLLRVAVTRIVMDTRVVGAEHGIAQRRESSGGGGSPGHVAPHRVEHGGGGQAHDLVVVDQESRCVRRRHRQRPERDVIQRDS